MTNAISNRNKGLYGVKVSKKLKPLRRIFTQWIWLNVRMGREWSLVNDLPWWYNERALVSLFAGAIWKCGGDAFEEFVEEKRGGQTGNKGRIDLWFKLGNVEYNAEAKKCWVDSSGGVKSISHINKVLSKAVMAANEILPDKRPRLAMVFGVAIAAKNTGKSNSEQLQALHEIARNPKIKADATTWVFPKLPKRHKGSESFLMPGVILWVKQVKRVPQN